MAAAAAPVKDKILAMAQAEDQKRRDAIKKQKEAEKAAMAAKTAAAAQEEEQRPKRKEVNPLIEDRKHWYDDAGRGFWREDDEQGWIGYNESQFRRYLKVKGYFSSPSKNETASQVDTLMVNIQHERRLDFAGKIAGYTPGIHNIAGNTILISRGPDFPEPKKGKWPTLKNLFADLLGDDAKYLYAWLKSAHVALRAGFPWRPGQLLAIAGQAGCGKSLLQNLITSILGGRSCKPYGYLTGQSSFNSSYYGCEHWMIEDEASSTDTRIRRTFGAMLKNVIVNQVQNYHPKGKDALSVTPYLRMTMSLNDTPESLLVMPPLEEDITDKIILLKGHKRKKPFHGPGEHERADFWRSLISEIPAFLFALETWDVPADIRDERYGVAAYQNKELLASVHALSNESRLLQIIDTCGFWIENPMGWQGQALELEQALLKLDKQGVVSRLLPYHTLCGLFLKRLCRTAADRVRTVKGSKRSNVYEIIPRGET